MGKKVNVVLWDGTTVAMDEDEAAKLNANDARPETVVETGTRARSEYNQENTSALRAAGEGAADTLSFGLYGAVKNSGEDGGERYRTTAKEHSTARVVGELAGALAPYGAFGKTVKAATSLTGVGAAASLGKTGTTVARVGEGALLGVGGRLAGTSVSGDPLSVEGLAEAAGIGALLNVGFGKAADLLLGSLGSKAISSNAPALSSLDGVAVAGRGKTPLADAARARAKLETAEAAEGLASGTKARVAAESADAAEAAAIQAEATAAYKEAQVELRTAKETVDSSPAYERFREAYQNTQAQIKKTNSALQKELDEYAKFTTPEGAEAVVKQYETVQAQLRERMARAAHSGEKEAAAKAKSFAAEDTAAKLAKVEATELKIVEAKLAAEKELESFGVKATRTKAKDVADQAAGDFSKAVKDKARPVVGEEGGFSSAVKDKARSEALKKEIADAEKSLAEIKEMKKGYKPEKVKAEVGAEANPDLPKLAEMQEALVEISKLKNTVKSAARDDQYEIAATAIGQVEGRLASLLPDLKLPKSPSVPVGELRETGARLPTKLSELGGKQKATVASYANALDDMSKGELDRLAAELGLSPGETAADTIVEIHKHMRGTFFGPKIKAPGAEASAVDDGLDDLVDDLTKSQAREGKTASAKWEAMSAEVDAARAGRPGNIDDLTGTTGYQEAAVGDMWSAGSSRGAAGSSSSGSILDGPIGAVKTGLVRGIGRSFDSGGWKGAVMRSLAGGTAGYALDGASGALYGGALLNGKIGVRGKVAEIFSKFAAPAATTLSRMGSVLAYASQSFPSGDDDKTEDPRDQVVNRIRDINQAAVTAPDAMYGLVQPMLGMPGDVALKLHQKVVQGLNYLKALAPKDPGIDKTAMGSTWRPSYTEADEYMHRFEAVMNPTAYVVRTLAGDGHPSGIEALAFNWPATLSEVLTEASVQDWSDLTLEQHRGLSMLFGDAMSSMQHPDVVAIIQGQFLPRAPVEGQGGSGQSGGTGKPNGRPPAVQSPVAGSNPGAHTSNV